MTYQKFSLSDYISGYFIDEDRNTISDDDFRLNEAQKDALYDLLSYRCHQRTKRRLRGIIDYDLKQVPNYGILGRVMFNGNTVSYVAGQSYPDEIRTVRSIVLDA